MVDLKEKLIVFERLLRTFDFGEMQTALQINRKLNKLGLDWNDYEEWIIGLQKDPDFHPPLAPMPERIRRKLERARLDWKIFNRWVDVVWLKPRSEVVRRRCPECGKSVEIHSINNNPEMMYGDKKYKTWWFCPNCHWEELSKKSIDEEMKKHLVRNNDNN